MAQKIRSKKRFNKQHRKKMSKAYHEGYLDKIINGKKSCPHCEQILPLRCFHKSKKRKNGYQLWCKKCGYTEKKITYHIYRKNRVKLLARKTLLKTNYNLSLEEYNDLLKKQNGSCAICRKPETQRSNLKGKIDSLRVDHDHKTNQIRGLLCSKCNFGISQFNDNTELLLKAINYLKKENRDENLIYGAKNE